MSIDPSIPPPPTPPLDQETPPSDPYVTPTAPPPVAVAGDNTVAVVAYLTLIGFIVALVINNGPKKNSLGNYHLRQALGLIIVGIPLWIISMVLMIIPILGVLLALCIFAGLFVLWLLGLIDAVNRREKPIPVIGAIIQDKLKNVFAS
ncbi:MAG: hypothetical protein QM755_00535 [Luteolibacter sp.]